MLQMTTIEEKTEIGKYLKDRLNKIFTHHDIIFLLKLINSKATDVNNIVITEEL